MLAVVLGGILHSSHDGQVFCCLFFGWPTLVFVSLHQLFIRLFQMAVLVMPKVCAMPLIFVFLLFKIIVRKSLIQLIKKTTAMFKLCNLQTQHVSLCHIGCNYSHNCSFFLCTLMFIIVTLIAHRTSLTLKHQNQQLGLFAASALVFICPNPVTFHRTKQQSMPYTKPFPLICHTHIKRITPHTSFT